MPRPTMDVDGSEYQAILHGREMRRFYGAQYKDLMWAQETLTRLERKLHHGDFYTDKDKTDFLKVRDIHAQVFNIKRDHRTKTTEEHVSTHYIWHTQGDDKVRGSHAANDGKVFSWNNPPPTGHPGEDWSCRCWAEPVPDKLEERKSQTVTYAKPDAFWSWGNVEIGFHYMFGNGEPKKLHEIGLLQDVIHHARTYNQYEAGGGTLFERVESQIFRAARENGAGSFADSFRGGRYRFGDLVWALGHVPVHGNIKVHVVEKDKYLIITADIDYKFIDRVGDLGGTYNESTGNPGEDIHGATPFYLTDEWSTRLEAVIKKDHSRSRYPNKWHPF